MGRQLPNVENHCCKSMTNLAKEFSLQRNLNNIIALSTLSLSSTPILLKIWNQILSGIRRLEFCGILLDQGSQTQIYARAIFCLRGPQKKLKSALNQNFKYRLQYSNVDAGHTNKSGGPRVWDPCVRRWLNRPLSIEPFLY